MKEQFLAGGGEMGRLTREKDWSNTPIGMPATWPQSLRTTLGIVLNSKFPMFLWWGPELICFYNDAYRPNLGENGKHPFILGMPAEDAWHEVWNIIKPLIDKVIENGVGSWHEDELIPIFRNGKIEDVYWTFSYNPVIDESGKVAGVLVTCNETTEKFHAFKKIEESEERFRMMAESADLLIAIGDETSNATWFNKAWVDFTGRPLEDLLEYGWADLVHPEDRDRFINNYQEVFKARQHFHSEFRILNKEGSYRWLLTKAPPRFHSDGSFAGYISSCIDITELKEADEALKVSEHRFRNLIIQSPVPMAIFRGKDHEIEMVNIVMAKRWEKRATGYLDKKIADAFPGIKNEKFLGLLNKVYETGEAYHESESKVVYEEFDELKTYYLDYDYTPMFDEKGNVTGIIATVNDITEKVMARKKVEDSEQRFRDIADTAPALIWMSGIDKLCYFFNKAWIKFTGRSIEQESGNGWAEGVHPEDLQKFLEIYNTAFENRKEFYMEYRLKRHDGEFRWITNNGVPRISANGIFEGYIGACMDIQEQKLFFYELEKQVIDRTHELQQKNSELERMNKELQSFAYISSHDLQEPL